MPLWFGVPVYYTLAGLFGTYAAATAVAPETTGAVLDGAGTALAPVGNAVASGANYVAQSTADSLGIGWLYSGLTGAASGVYSLVTTVAANPGFLAGAFGAGAAVGLAADYFAPNTNSSMNKSAWIGLAALVAGVGCFAMGDAFSGTMFLSSGLGSLSANLLSKNQIERSTLDISHQLNEIKKAVSLNAPAPA